MSCFLKFMLDCGDSFSLRVSAIYDYNMNLKDIQDTRTKKCMWQGQGERPNLFGICDCDESDVLLGYAT